MDLRVIWGRAYDIQNCINCEVEEVVWHSRDRDERSTRFYQAQENF